MSKREPDSVSYRTQSRPDQVILSGRRLDGRGYEEFRPAFFNAGTLSQAAGSAYAEQGNTKIMVAVYGPRESDRREAYSSRGRLQVDIKRTSFCTATRTSTRQTDADKEGAAILEAALEAAVQLEAFPKSVVDVYCLVMESGGSDLAVMLSAAALALADAGIPMFDLVTACGVCRIGGQLLLDPTLDESYREDGGCLLALMPTQNKVTQLIVTGEWRGDDLGSVIELAVGGCLQLDVTLRQTLEESLAR